MEKPLTPADGDKHIYTGCAVIVTDSTVFDFNYPPASIVVPA